MSMLPYNVEVTLKEDSEPREYEISMAALIEWETHFTDMTFREWTMKQTNVGLAYLGFAAARDNGVVMKPFKEWSKTVAEVRLVPKDED